MGFSKYLYAVQYSTRAWMTGQMYQLRQCLLPETGKSNQGFFDHQNVVMVYAGLIGDTIMSIPVITEARRLWPNANITLLGNRQACELLAGCPFLDSFHLADADPFSIRKRPVIWELKRWLHNQRFDVGIIVLGDQFAELLACAGIPIRVGVKGHYLAPCVTHVYDICGPRTWGPHERLNALRCLGYKVNDVPPQLWVADENRASWRKQCQTLDLGGANDYVVIHPFGRTQDQWWPIEAVETLVDELFDRYALRTVLIGAIEHRREVPESLAAKVTNTTGSLSLQELLAAIESSALVISTDSGPFHIAGALGRPLIGLFRRARPEHAERYPMSRSVFGAHPLCDNSCDWDRCEATPCRQLSNLKIGNILREADNFLSCSVTR